MGIAGAPRGETPRLYVMRMRRLPLHSAAPPPATSSWFPSTVSPPLLVLIESAEPRETVCLDVVDHAASSL